MLKKTPVGIALLALLLSSNITNACSRILFAPANHPVMIGRNMDWVEDMHTNLFVYPRGIARKGMDSANPLRWESKYGSLTASAYDLATTDGINEKGFYAEVNALISSDYGTRDAKLPGMSVLQWTQFYLDSFATVKEAVAYTEAHPFQLNPFYSPQVGQYLNVHLSLADPTGDSAIIEFIGGKIKIYHDPSYKVMTNDPPYDQQLENLKDYQGFGGDKPLPGTTLAKDRFVRASYYVNHLPEPRSVEEEVSEVFSVMHNVEQPFGVESPERPIMSTSIWRVVGDLTNRVYYFNSLLKLNTFWVQLDKFDFSKKAPVMKLNVADNAALAGDVTDKFEPTLS